MDEQQLSEYLKFILSLLTCESGTENSVFQEYSHLVDQTLPQLMVAVAEQHEQAEQPQDMSWLRQVAAMLTAKIDNWNQLNAQVVTLYQQGEISTAMPIAEQSLALAQEVFPSPNNNLAASLNNLAGLYKAQGKWAEAEPLYDEALAICRTLFGERPNNDLATSLNNLAALYAAQGKWAEAEPLYDEALAIRRTLFGERPNNDLAASLNNLAGLYRSQGKWAEAEPLYDEALAIFRTLFGERPNNDLAASLNNLAGLYEAQGKWAEAEPLYDEALAIRRRLFGDIGHPDLVTSLTNLALAHAQLQQPDKALPLLQEAIAVENQWLTNVIAINDSQQRLQDLEQRQPQLEYLLSLTQTYFPDDPTAVTAAFNAVLSRKAQAVAAEATFSQAIRNHPELAPDVAQLQLCQQEIATLSYTVASQPELKQQLNDCLKQRQNLQKKLARSIPAIALAQQVVDRQALTHLLPADAFLVEFVRYRPLNFITKEWQAARYLAFIVRPDRTNIIAIDCGAAAALDLAIDQFRRSYAENYFSGENSGAFDRLRSTSTDSPATTTPDPLTEFLNQLLPQIPPTGTCYLALDSYLQILPFHLLKTAGAETEYLSDRYHLHYLTTARDILRRQLKTSANAPIIVADPDYNGGTTTTSVANIKTGLQVSDRLPGQPFDQLPINRILGEKVAAAYQVPYYTDIDATVDRLAQITAPSLLMIASHGFSLPARSALLETLSTCPESEEETILRDRSSEITPEFRAFCQQYAAQGNEWCQRLLAKIDRILISKPTPVDLLATLTNDPMLRSGIALAGANIWRFQGISSPEFGKGVVFAHDIAQWDLWGTELSLINTCVSGLGAVTSSEGVFGLRRALAIAGSKYVISSLWNIPTKPSVLLMDKFFELYQSQAYPPPAALAAAQTYIRDITLGELNEIAIGREIIEELRSDLVRLLPVNATADCQPLAHPHFWGAWICQG